MSLLEFSPRAIFMLRLASATGLQNLKHDAVVNDKCTRYEKAHYRSWAAFLIALESMYLRNLRSMSFSGDFNNL
jgi:fibrillarin-like rRNA methylase